MLAQKDPVIDEAVSTAHKLILDERERYRMEARERTLIHERVIKERMEQLTAALGQATAERDDLAKQPVEAKKVIQELTDKQSHE